MKLILFRENFQYFGEKKIDLNEWHLKDLPIQTFLFFAQIVNPIQAIMPCNYFTFLVTLLT